MKNLKITVLVFSIICMSLLSVAQKHQVDDSRYKLWFEQPASNWNEALPIGNGYIGGMVFGNPALERVQLNESTIWGGGPNNNLDSSAYPHVLEVRALLSQKKYEEAQLTANQYLGPKGNSGMPYQLAGNLYIQFKGHEHATNYYRELDIHQAIATVKYTIDGVNFKREYLTAFGSNVMMVRLTADKPRMISCKIKLQSPLMQNIRTEKQDLVLTGKGSDHENQKGKIKFDMVTRAKLTGGSSVVDSSGISISQADTAIVFVSIATNFVNYHDLSADPYAKASNTMAAAFTKGFSELRDAHIKYYQTFFNRVKLTLGSTNEANFPTNIRIKNFAASHDTQLAELYFQFGRYLLICSSQPGSQAANLQGIWNGELKGPWDSKYTVNINTEMNYWPSEVTQLSELGKPLFNMINDLAVTGKSTAAVMYKARGWMLHHNTDIWRITGVVDGAYWGLWPTANAWLCQHLWEHYLYTGDKAFLEKYYPVMKGASQYFIDVLQKEPEHGWLVVAPSVSPEHEYISGKNSVSVSAGTTMDNQLVYGLFTNVINAAAVLHMDNDFSDSLKRYRSQLPPMQIGQFGQLQEWQQDVDRTDDNHRHVSHLYGLFPGNQISPFTQPQLFAAARNSLLYRGDVSTGWSMAWKINLWAHLLDGNHAYKLIKDQIKPVTGGSGGTYPNLFDAHPPFQIDGNFGCTSGIAEMLLQSHDGAIYLLPALPNDWTKGEISGIAARGGFTIDLGWTNGKITKLIVHSALGGNCRIRVNHIVGSKMLKAATGTNSNAFYQQIDVKSPIVKKTAIKLNNAIPQTWLYDLKTQRNKVYKVI